jgi:hypothetical protein
MKSARSSFPSLAEAALPKAVELADVSGARVLLLRAAQASTLLGADLTEAQVRVVREAEDYLAALKDRLAKSGRASVETSVWYGPAAYAIVEAARIRKVDQIVMTHPRPQRPGPTPPRERGGVGPARHHHAHPAAPRGGRARRGPDRRGQAVGRAMEAPRKRRRTLGAPGGEASRVRRDRCDPRALARREAEVPEAVARASTEP